MRCGVGMGTYLVAACLADPLGGRVVHLGLAHGE